MKRMVPSWFAFLAALIAIAGGYVLAAFKTSAPFAVYAPTVGGLAGAYFAKRVVDKKYLNGEQK